MRRRREGKWILPVAVAFLAAVGAIVAHQLWGGRSYAPANTLFVIYPYRYEGQWVFDDDRVGLRREPFVAGIPQMIDRLVKEIPNADKGFRLMFSAEPFPGATIKLAWRRNEGGGAWYWSHDLRREGWVCSALIRYYREPPKEIYAKAESRPPQ